jgi:hypothetical protein
MIPVRPSLAFLLATTGFAAAVDVPPSSPAVRIFARTWVPTPDDVQWSWSGSGALIAFTGTSCSALLSDRGAVVSTRVDGVEGKVFDLSNNYDTLLALATGILAGPHVVEFRQRTESQYSQARFHGFRIEGTPTTPRPRSSWSTAP